MDFKIAITFAARSDLGTIAGYIARDDKEVALKFGRALIKRAKSLSSQPMMGREITLQDGIVVRQIIHRQYRILYELDEPSKVVYILRFWHSARGEPKLTDEG